MLIVDTRQVSSVWSTGDKPVIKIPRRGTGVQVEWHEVAMSDLVDVVDRYSERQGVSLVLMEVG